MAPGDVFRGGQGVFPVIAQQFDPPARSNGATWRFHITMEMMSRRAYGFENFENDRLRVLAHGGCAVRRSDSIINRV